MPEPLENQEKTEIHLENKDIYNQRDIEEIVSKDIGLPRKDVKEVLDAVWATIHEKVEQGSAVRFQGVGRFYLSERGEHPARNLRTGENIIIGRHQALRFSPSRTYAKRLRVKTEQLSKDAQAQNAKTKANGKS